MELAILGFLAGVSASAAILTLKRAIDMQVEFSEKLTQIDNKIGSTHFYLNKNLKENEYQIVKAQVEHSLAIKRDISNLFNTTVELKEQLNNEIVNTIRKELILPPKDKQYIVLPVTEDSKIIPTTNIDKARFKDGSYSKRI